MIDRIGAKFATKISSEQIIWRDTDGYIISVRRDTVGYKIKIDHIGATFVGKISSDQLNWRDTGVYTPVRNRTAVKFVPKRSGD